MTLSPSSKIAELVERFTDHTEAYQSGQYNEAQLRQEFIDPMFKLLGWDMDNVSGHAEAYKDVIHEDAIKIGGATKAPDYCFRIGGTRKFFLEANWLPAMLARWSRCCRQFSKWNFSTRLAAPSRSLKLK